MDDLQQAVAKLRALSPKLNSAADQAYRVVMQIEHFLANECQVAVQAEVPVIYNDKGVVVTLMRYGRIDGRFRIALTNTDGDARFITRAWADCDRSEKLASFPALPRLVMAVTKAVESQIASTTATANTVNQIISALGAEMNVDGEPRVEEPAKLALFVKPEDVLAAIGPRPTPRPREVPKMNPDGDSRRPHRKEEAKVG
jgi:hypothetical protein